MAERANIKVARELARNLLKKSGVKTAPILIRDLLPVLENVEVYAWQNFDDEIGGAQVSDGEKSYIAYNDKHPTVMKRATLAHEIGHSLLNHTNPNNPSRFDYERGQTKENEAWYFARELLMPIKQFKEAFMRYKNIKKLAAIFWVSESMACIRVEELGLLSKI